MNKEVSCATSEQIGRSNHMTVDYTTLNTLYEKHYSNMMANAYRMLHNHEDAEEAVQDTFVRLYLHLHEMKNEQHTHLWIFRVLKNRCIDILRKRKHRHNTISYDDILDHSYTLDYDAVEIRDEISQSLQGLRAKDLQVLHADLEYGGDYNAASVALGQSSDVYRTRLHRAKERIRYARKKLHYSEVVV